MNEEYNQFIGIYKNVLDQKIIDGFLEWYDFAEEHNYTIAPHRNMEESKVFPHVKKTAQEGNVPGLHIDESIVLPTSSTFTQQHFPGGLCSAYWECLHNCFKQYDNKYTIAPKKGMLINPYFKIHKVKKSEGFHAWHFENGEWLARDRYLVYMTYLKSPESGGETEFLHQSMRIKPEAGTTLLWPAGFTHKHRGNPPLEGEKMYITGWLNLFPNGEGPVA